MKEAYPVIFVNSEKGVFRTFAPDFGVAANGATVVEAIDKTRFMIGQKGIEIEDRGEAIPLPFSDGEIEQDEGEFLSLIDIDFDEFRRAHDLRTVRRNVSLPSWLNVAADKAGINVSAVLQDALKRELNLQ